MMEPSTSCRERSSCTSLISQVHLTLSATAAEGEVTGNAQPPSYGLLSTQQAGLSV